MGKYALLIGVDTYGEGLQPLPAASKDVMALQAVLLNPQIGAFDEAKPLINPTQPDMAREIELWFQERQPEDLVLLFFSGHGVKDDRRELYFAATNTEKPRNRLLTSTATPARFIHNCIRDCKAKSQVLILDCCFSGAFGDAIGRDDGDIPLEEQLGAEGRVVMTSTSAVDYSFEEKGADLSIYTRYLVEGLATGAADEEGNGWITVDALHRYAGRKVKETSPVMSPCLITLKDEGFRITIARSPQDNPRLKYRKEAERRVTEAGFTIPAKRLLILRRAELGLSNAEAEAIEAELLKPYQGYQHKCQAYQETLRDCLPDESSFMPPKLQHLIDYRAKLQLNPKDAAKIEQGALLGHTLEGYVAELEHQQRMQAYQQTEVEWQRQEAKRQQQLKAISQRLRGEVHHQVVQDDLSSEKGIDYTRLRDLLKAQDWRAADRETYEVMIRAVGKKSGDWFTRDELMNFPCIDLHTIDGLWMKYSQGRFGFSVQKKIYVECGAKLDGQYPSDKVWHKFCNRVGWRAGVSYLSYKDLKVNSSLSPSGELPSLLWLSGGVVLDVLSGFVGVVGVILLSRVKTCNL